MKRFLITAILLMGCATAFSQRIPTLPSAPKATQPEKVKPAAKPRPAQTQTIKFISNAEADLFIDGEKRGHLRPGAVFKLGLPKGDYLLKIVNAQNSADVISETYSIAGNGGEVLYQADLQTIINNRLATEAAVKRKALQEEEEKKKQEEAIAKLSDNMVYIPGGTFTLGERYHKAENVTISSFYISKYEVTFYEYDAFCNATGHVKANDQGMGRGNRAVINVNWDDAVAYCAWLSLKTGKQYRLPTMAEWEYAARGGNRGRNSSVSRELAVIGMQTVNSRSEKKKKGNDNDENNGYSFSGSNSIDEVAWYGPNSGGVIHPVGQKRPNELGLYDMSGNAAEWCSDWYTDNADNAFSQLYSRQNPTGPVSGIYRVTRGGCYTYTDPDDFRLSAHAGPGSPGSRYDNRCYGFRIVCIVSSQNDHANKEITQEALSPEGADVSKRLGAELENSTSAGRGVGVKAINNGPLKNANVRPGFVITSVSGQVIQNITSLEAALKNAAGIIKLLGHYADAEMIYSYSVNLNISSN